MPLFTLSDIPQPPPPAPAAPTTEAELAAFAAAAVPLESTAEQEAAQAIEQAQEEAQELREAIEANDLGTLFHFAEGAFVPGHSREAFSRLTSIFKQKYASIEDLAAQGFKLSYFYKDPETGEVRGAVYSRNTGQTAELDQPVFETILWSLEEESDSDSD